MEHKIIDLFPPPTPSAIALPKVASQDFRFTDDVESNLGLVPSSHVRLPYA